MICFPGTVGDNLTKSFVTLISVTNFPSCSIRVLNVYSSAPLRECLILGPVTCITSLPCPTFHVC